MSEFLTIGEPMVVLASQNIDSDLTDIDYFKKSLAGAELNVAVGVSRLGHSAQYISAVGEDPFGKYIQKAIKNNNINTDYLVKDADRWTGFYLKQSVSHGDPNLYYYRKNSAAANLNPSIIEKINLEKTKIAHLSGIFAALSASDLISYKKLNQRLLEKHVLITFDPNLRPALWNNQAEMIKVTNEIAKSANIILPGIDEGEILVGSNKPEEIADFYLGQSQITSTVVVKLGPNGAFVKNKEGANFRINGFNVDNVVDTVGAGDGFAVGLISSLLEGKPMKEAVEIACAIGALAVQNPGDSDGYPSQEQLVKFLSLNRHIRRNNDYNS